MSQRGKPRQTRRTSARAGSPHRGLLIRITAGGAILAIVGTAIAIQAGGGADDPGVAFTINAPTDGATVSSPVTLDVALHGSQLGSPGDGLDHLHLSLDGGQPIAEYSSSRLPLQIPSGRHTLTVELAGPDHAPLLPDRSVTFTVTG